MCLTKVLLRFCTEEPFDFNHPEGIPQLAAGKLHFSEGKTSLAEHASLGAAKLHLRSSPLRRGFNISIAKIPKKRYDKDVRILTSGLAAGEQECVP